MPVSNLYRPAASTDATSSFANPIDFLETNYPCVRDLTHKFRTAGGFSDFNHTSVLVPRSNLHCLSLAPALCQLYIDYYPALTLYSYPSLSVSICQLSLSFSLLMAGEKQPEGLRQKRTEQEWWFPLETAIDFVTCWGHLFLCQESEWTNYLVLTLQNWWLCKAMLVVSRVNPRWLINSLAGGLR